MKDNFENVVAVDYDSSNLSEAIDQIEEQIKDLKDGELVFVGSSLGGYFARFLAEKYHSKSILINPSTDVNQLRGLNKKQIIFHSNKKYKLKEKAINSLVKYSTNYCSKFGILILLDEGDNVIDFKDTYNKYRNSALIFTFSNGSHRFDHMKEAKREIDQFINR